MTAQKGEFSIPRSFNLSAVAEALERRGEHRDLVQAIRDQMDTASRHADLIRARDLVALLTQLEENKHELPKDGPVWDAFVNAQAAVLAHAVVLYVRAAAPGDRGRKLTYRVEDVLKGEGLAIHAALEAARNTALAHFDRPDRQDWHADCLVMIKHENGDWHYGTAAEYRRSLHSGLSEDQC